jgi:hypothetical protein
MAPRRFKLKKYLKLTEPLGSEKFTNLFNPVLGKLHELHRKGQIRSNPQQVMLVLDAFNAADQIPALSYNNYFMDFGGDDHPMIDRLLQTMGVVEPTVVFDDSEDAVLDLGLTPGIHYTNGELIEQVFKPKTPLALDLVDAAVYARRVPKETLYDLLYVPRSIRTALTRILQLAGDGGKENGAKGSIASTLERYAERDTEEKLLDAKTLAALIFNYASDSYTDIRARAKELSTNFAVLFNQPEDIPALVTLKNYLASAAEKTASKDTIELTAQIEKAIGYRKKQQKKRELTEEDILLGFTRR